MARRDLNQARRVRQTCVQGTGCATKWTSFAPPGWTNFAPPLTQKGFARWHGDGAARRAVTNNRTRLLSGVAKEAFKLRAEIVERSFAHNLDRGGMRRTWLRGRENVHKRYLLHVAGHNLIPPSGMPDLRWGFPSGPISDSMW